jgi:glycine/D-amino acid oxidase-like deaminating enzyme
VHTPRGQITAPLVLLATNGYTSRLLPAFTNVIVPTQGQVAALLPRLPPSLSSPSPSPTDVTLTHTYGFWANSGDGGAAASRDDYLAQSQLGRREIVYGGGRRFSHREGWGVSDDSFVDPAVSRFLRTDLLSGDSLDLASLALDPAADASSDSDSDSLPDTPTSSTPSHDPAAGDVPALTPTAEWTGIMGYSRDWLPWVGPVPASLGGAPGLFVCAGYSGHGMPVAPLCAAAVVALMAGKSLSDVDLPPEFYVADGSPRV